MKKLGRPLFAALIANLFLLSGLSAALAAEAADQPTTPWTQEKVKPPEVQDKEKKKDDPIATCDKEDKNTKEKFSEATYMDGTVVRYYPGKGPLASKWIITIPGPKGKTKITYDSDKKTRTVEEPGKQPVEQDPKKDPAAKDWRDAKEKEAKEAADAKKTELEWQPWRTATLTANPGEVGAPTWPFSANQLASVAYRGSEPVSSAPREAAPPLILAATVERSQAEAPRTQEKGTVLNIKIVTYGNPPPGTTIYIDPGPPTTPEHFTENPHPSWWDWFTDPGRPLTFPGPTEHPGQPGRPEHPGQPGQPGQPPPGPGTTPIPGPDDWPTPGPGGGWIHVGWGWASGMIPQAVAGSCAGVDTNNLPQTQSGGGTTPQTTEKEDYKGFFGAERRTPQTTARNCSEIEAKINYLMGLLRAIHENNMKHAKAASDAFWGDPKSKYYGGYAHWFSSAKITEAVVDAENATGKALIDTALFAMGGWGGFGGKFGEAADVLFGSGIRGAESAAGVYEKIATKVLEKAANSFTESEAGLAGETLAKTIEKSGEGGFEKSAETGKWEYEPSKWYQGIAGGLESAVRGAVIEKIGDWMKEGAMEGDLERAKESYTEFLTNANLANLDAATGKQVKKELEDLLAEAKEQHCPTPQIPQYGYYTFDIKPFGEGMFQGQKGPEMHFVGSDGTVRDNWDMFGRTSSPL